MLTCNDVIRKRKDLWNKSNNINTDREYINSIADYMLSEDGEVIRKEVLANPEYMIEMFFSIVDKKQKTVPFFLNDVQQELLDIINNDIKLYEKGKIHHLKYLLLKGRQAGMTSFISAYQLANSITRKNFQGYTLADTADNTEAIFADKAKYYLDQLPEQVKPSIRYSNRRELDFSKEDGKGLNSKWRVATSGNTDAGRSKTLNFFHGSEAAFFKELNKVLVGLSEALTANAIVILESTANGYNEFRNLWVDETNNYKKLFFPWYKTKEYVLPFYDKKEENDLVRLIKKTSSDDADTIEWLSNQLYFLKELGLSNEQLNWYYHKWKDKRETIKQEYPCVPEEAFLSTGRNYFNTTQLAKRIVSVTENYDTGLFLYDYGTSVWTGEKTIKEDSIRFCQDSSGSIKIFEHPTLNGLYTIGADTAGKGSDYNVAQVIDEYGRQVAILRLKIDEDLFADQLYCLGKYYNYALIAPENNFSTYVTNTLNNREYPSLYVRENRPDAISKRTQSLYGFNTNRANRPVMLARLKELVRDNVEYINDKTTLEEMFTFVVNENGKPEAAVGEHDDTVMAYAIALYIQDQATRFDTKKEPTKLKGFYTDEELEDLGYNKYEIELYKKGDDLFWY
jgi:hypothetical protein